MGFFNKVLDITGGMVGFGRKDILSNRCRKIYSQTYHSRSGNLSEEELLEQHHRALIYTFIDWHDSKYKTRPYTDNLIELGPFLSYEQGSYDALFSYICILDCGETTSEYSWTEFIEFINKAVDYYPEKAAPGIIKKCTWVGFIEKDILNEIARKYPEVQIAKNKDQEVYNLLLNKPNLSAPISEINPTQEKAIPSEFEELNNKVKKAINQNKPVSFFDFFYYLQNNQVPPISWEKMLEISDFNEIRDGINPIIYAFSYNTSNNLNLTNKQLNDFIFCSNLKFQNDREYDSGENALMSAFKNNKRENLNLSNQQLNFLIRNSDLKQFIHKWDAVPEHRKDALRLTYCGEGDYGIGDSDLGHNALFLAFMNNIDQSLNLSHNQFKFLIINSDPLHYDDNANNAILYAVRYFEKQKIPLDNFLWDYLIENSKVESMYYYGVIVGILEPYHKENCYINFTPYQWKKMINKLEKNPEIYQNLWQEKDLFEIMKKNRNVMGLSYEDLKNLYFTKKGKID